jgi:hypothetical protein
MAIPFISVGFFKFRDERGACAITAYVGRNVVQARSGKRYDFRRFRGDLVHEEVVMPQGVTAAPPRPAQLARMIDAAEAPRTKKRNRSRWQQLLLTLVVALPPDTECSLDEAIEFCHAVVDRVIVDQALVAYLAIHDPAVKPGGSKSRNRHAHIHVALRTWTPEGTLSRYKARDLVARVRHYTGSKGAFDAVAEGIRWPDVSRELQTRLFTRCGRDVVVDPIALIPQRHFGKLTWHHEEEVVKKHLVGISMDNRSALAAPAEDIIAKMLRGRSSLPSAELRVLVDRYIDSEQDRRDLLERIAADRWIINLAPPEGPINRITTRAVQTLFAGVYRIIDDVADVPDSHSSGAGGFRVVFGSRTEAITGQIADYCRDVTTHSHAGPPKYIKIVGQFLSHCGAVHASLGSEHENTSVATVEETLVAASEIWNSNTIVVLPRSEAIADEDLANLIVAADEANAQLALGYDVSKADGVAERRLATWIVERLMPEAVYTELARSVEPVLLDGKLLDAGFIRSAVTTMLSRRTIDSQARPGLVFSGEEVGSGRPASAESGSVANFIVLDDPRAIHAMTESERTSDIKPADLKSMKTPRGRLLLAVGEWIVFEKADYSNRPPQIREGCVAKILSITEASSTLLVEHDRGGTSTIDLNKFPFVRPAHVLTIAEARQLMTGHSLDIRVTKRDRVFPTLLLATEYRGPSMITISPLVATNPDELVAAAEAHLPAVLPWQLEPRRDLLAEQNADVANILGRSSLRDPRLPSTETSGSEVLAPPAVKAVLRSPSIRGLTTLTLVHREGFENLLRALAPQATDRLETAERLLARPGVRGSLLGQIVEAMLKVDRLKPGQKPYFAGIDSPTALDELVAEFEPTLLELSMFKTDLVALAGRTLGLGKTAPRSESSQRTIPSINEHTEEPVSGPKRK